MSSSTRDWMMSSGTSTDAAPATFRPWHFFVLAGLAGATIAVVTVRPSGIAPLVLVVLAAWAGAYVGYAVYRMIVPLAARDFAERVEMVGGRTRAALDREKTLVLRSSRSWSSTGRWGRCPTRTSTRWEVGFAPAPARS